MDTAHGVRFDDSRLHAGDRISRSVDSRLFRERLCFTIDSDAQRKPHAYSDAYRNPSDGVVA